MSFGLSGVIAVVITLQRMMQMGPWPSGLDGGEWLAIGRGLLGGVGRSTEGAYAPLVPITVASLARMIGEVDAVRAMAAGSLVAVLLAVALVCTRGERLWIGPVAVVIVGSSATVSEPLAFGGYPQNVALAGTVLAVAGTAGWLATEQRPWLIAAAVGGITAALSHHLYGMVAVVGMAMVTGLQVIADRRVPRERWVVAVVVIASSVGCLLPTLLAFRHAGYAPPLSAGSTTRLEAWAYGMREAPWVWVVLVSAAVVVTIRGARGGSSWRTRAGAVMAMGGLAGFAFTTEVRVLPLVVLGTVLILAEGLAVLEVPRYPMVLPAAVIVCAWWISIAGTREAKGFFAFYQTLDGSMLAAAEVIDKETFPGAVAAQADARQWPVGWWYEGLTTTPIVVGSNPRWLGFPDERVRADVAAHLFDGSLTSDALRSAATEAGVGGFVIRKWDWIGWQRWLDAENPAVEVVFDDNEIVALRLVP